MADSTDSPTTVTRRNVESTDTNTIAEGSAALTLRALGSVMARTSGLHSGEVKRVGLGRKFGQLDTQTPAGSFPCCPVLPS